MSRVTQSKMHCKEYMRPYNSYNLFCSVAMHRFHALLSHHNPSIVLSKISQYQRRTYFARRGVEEGCSLQG
jgi:hypothetical protein